MWLRNTSPVHWGWGVLGGAVLGRTLFGDEWWQVGAGAFLGTPWGHRGLAYGTRASAYGIHWAVGTRAGLAVRSGAWGLARFGGMAALAVGAPVAIGYGASHLIAGKEGTDDFTDFITGGVSPSEWWDAISLKSMR